MPKKLKKDFDRDQMYLKIMPTSAIEPEEAGARPTPSQPVRQAPEKPLSEPELLGPGLHNYMEDLLREKLPHTMKVLRACTCERCQLDILAIALNTLPPAYAVMEENGSLERVKKLRREYEVKVTATLIKAIQQVKFTPRHSKEKPSPNTET